MTTPTSPDDALTVRDAALILDLTIDHVRGLIRSGTLPAWTDSHDLNYRVRRHIVEAHRDGTLNARPSEMFEELGAYEAERQALQKKIDDLIQARNRSMVDWSDRGASTTAIAQAAHLGRQHATNVLEKTRLRIASEK